MLAAKRPAVLFLAADAVLLGHLAGEDAHLNPADGAGEGVGEGIHDLPMTEAIPPAGLGQDVGRLAHALHPASDDDLGLAVADESEPQSRRLEC